MKKMNPIVWIWLIGFCAVARATEPIDLRFEPLTSIAGTTESDLKQARTAYIPIPKLLWITTTSQTGKTGTHDFHDIYQSFSRNRGKSWSRPLMIPSLRQTKQPDGFEFAPGDLWPTSHARTGTVLATGKTFRFADGIREVLTARTHDLRTVQCRERGLGSAAFSGHTQEGSLRPPDLCDRNEMVFHLHEGG